MIPGYPGHAIANPAAMPGYPGAPPAYAPPQPPAVAAPPGVPQPAYGQPPAAPAAPQGYPGPAVAAPPAPTAYGPPVGYAPAAYAPPQPAYGPPGTYPTAPPAGYGAPAPVANPYAGQDVGAMIAAATGGGDRADQPEAGKYDLEILDSVVSIGPREKGGKRTFKMIMKVLKAEPLSPAHPPPSPVNAHVAYIEGLEYSQGQGRTQDAIVNAIGFPNVGALFQAYIAAGVTNHPDALKAELGKLAGACAQPDTTPLKGRRVSAVVTKETKTAKAPSPKAGQLVTYTNFRWSPLA
jgi:hypothetical protein